MDVHAFLHTFKWVHCVFDGGGIIERKYLGGNAYLHLNVEFQLSLLLHLVLQLLESRIGVSDCG